MRIAGVVDSTKKLQMLDRLIVNIMLHHKLMININMLCNIWVIGMKIINNEPIILLTWDEMCEMMDEILNFVIDENGV
jgi:hypothetical protein